MSADSETVPLAKGSTLIDLVKTARRNREAFDRVLPPETRDFVDKRVLVGSWYPEAHLRDLLSAVDRVLGKGDFRFCREVGRQAVRNHLHGLYASILVWGIP